MKTLFEENFPKTLMAFEVPGAAIAVVKNDELVFASGYGVCEMGKERHVDEHTLFATGSISKSFTALSLAILVGEGKLGWDDKVTKYLPGFQLYDAYATREITIRDLLTHRSGLAEVSGGTVWYGSDYDRNHVINRLRHIRPVSSFRSKFSYQNVMYLVAGEIIPVITGLSWDDFVQQRLLTPLKMESTNTSTRALVDVSNYAIPHSKITRVLQPVAYRNYDNVAPAASINSSAIDLIQYLRFYLNDGMVGDLHLMDSTALSELTQAQISIPIDPGPPELKARLPKFYAYGLGWFLRDYHGRKVVMHTGGVDGMAALVAFVPEEKLGLVVLTNQESSFIGATCYHILDAFMDIPQTNWFDLYLTMVRNNDEQDRAAKEKGASSRVTGTQPSLTTSAYAGRFRDILYGDAMVTWENDRLVLSFEHSACFTGDLEHWHYNTFRIHWRDPMVPLGLVTFVLNSQAGLSEMKFDQPNLLDVNFSELNFTRISEGISTSSD